MQLNGQLFSFENSQHPYLPYSTEVSNAFESVGALWWSFTFDSSTSTEYGYDFVVIYEGSLDGPILYSNSGSLWPTVNISCSTAIVVAFSSDLDIESWGVKM